MEYRIYRDLIDGTKKFVFKENLEKEIQIDYEQKRKH